MDSMNGQLYRFLLPLGTPFRRPTSLHLYRCSYIRAALSLWSLVCPTEVSFRYFTIAFIPNTYSMQYRICIGEYI